VLKLQFFIQTSSKSPLILWKLLYTLLSSADSLDFFLAVTSFRVFCKKLYKTISLLCSSIQCLYWLFNVTKATPANNLLAGRVQSGGSRLLSDGNFIYWQGNYSTTILCNRPWSTANLRLKSKVLIILCFTLFNEVL